MADAPVTVVDDAEDAKLIAERLASAIKPLVDLAGPWDCQRSGNPEASDATIVGELTLGQGREAVSAYASWEKFSTTAPVDLPGVEPANGFVKARMVETEFERGSAEGRSSLQAMVDEVLESQGALETRIGELEEQGAVAETVIAKAVALAKLAGEIRGLAIEHGLQDVAERLRLEELGTAAGAFLALEADRQSAAKDFIEELIAAAAGRPDVVVE